MCCVGEVEGCTWAPNLTLQPPGLVTLSEKEAILSVISCESESVLPALTPALRRGSQVPGIQNLRVQGGITGLGTRMENTAEAADLCKLR